MKTENMKKLAKEMNVHVADLKCLAVGVVNSMKQDRVAQIYINETEENQIKMALAYVQNEVKKFDKFVTTYLTNDEARNCLEQQVLNMLIN